ncbi:MAG: UDP-N-acetylglucosamine--N-acetylmuramyl-(pentapeptide) pyrophosphoryl-undecaprenol N-acetylglucosamine transferase [Spirochaetaceae bacterium]|jgi:UDP-N-acetylglucosamine--N-acetylmuramyl-(pentapeptide) pyrophosphoryl-undecaprenol N-acetylglucosamine transferase|nr:UDP-N-acetylglucosamine--N-acetylmuramyl-(pentapeptide) pyrophosphoryl-undecaprenol N-acetylglucosamine transferase [Spirochaetaceae bacterium]
MLTIALTGGGTGGHIYPGIAVAEALVTPGAAESAPENGGTSSAASGIRVFWIGSRNGMDRSIVEEAGILFYGVSAGKLRRYLSFKNVLDMFRVLSGFFASRRILKKERPAALFSKGGFVSVAPCAAARSLGIPVFTHESDLSPGLATRINARFARMIFTAYGETARRLGKYASRVKVSGNPVRGVFFRACRETGRAFLGLSDEKPVLLVLGGSQGALEINELVAAWLPGLVSRFTVVHQTGSKWEAPAATESYRPCRYLNREMPHVLAASDLVLGRSGAGTLWECAVLGRPMVLIPLRGRGTRGDQVENAEVFRKAGAAVVLAPEELRNGQGLSRVLALADDAGKLAAMAACSREMGRTDAASCIAETMLHSIGGDNAS